jgi:Cytochrome c
MRIPHIFRIGALVLATTGFYTYVGQMVPQKEVLPPEDAAIGAEMTTADMVKVGRQIMTGKGLCLTCHTVGKTGALRFPDLQGIGERAKTRVNGLSDVEYLAQSLYEPMAFVVPGFPPAMPPMNQPPFGLTDQEILCVIAALQTYGGTPTVTLQTTHKYSGKGAGAPGGTAAPEAATDPGAAPAEEAAPAEPKKGAQLRPGAAPQLIAVHQATRLGGAPDRAEARQGNDGGVR